MFQGKLMPPSSGSKKYYGNRFLQNVGAHPYDYIALQLRRLICGIGICSGACKRDVFKCLWCINMLYRYEEFLCCGN